MTATRSRLHRAGGSLAAALLPLSAWAVDVDPGDCVPRRRARLQASSITSTPSATGSTHRAGRCLSIPG